MDTRPEAPTPPFEQKCILEMLALMMVLAKMNQTLLDGHLERQKRVENLVPCPLVPLLAFFALCFVLFLNFRFHFHWRFDVHVHGPLPTSANLSTN